MPVHQFIDFLFPSVDSIQFGYWYRLWDYSACRLYQIWFFFFFFFFNHCGLSIKFLFLNIQEDRLVEWFIYLIQIKTCVQYHFYVIFPFSCSFVCMCVCVCVLCVCMCVCVCVCVLCMSVYVCSSKWCLKLPFPFCFLLLYPPPPPPAASFRLCLSYQVTELGRKKLMNKQTENPTAASQNFGYNARQEGRSWVCFINWFIVVPL